MQILLPPANNNGNWLHGSITPKQEETTWNQIFTIIIRVK